MEAKELKVGDIIRVDNGGLINHYAVHELNSSGWLRIFTKDGDEEEIAPYFKNFDLSFSPCHKGNGWNGVKKGDTIVVWFSCGAASAVAAYRTIQKYKDIANIRIVNNPIKEEHEDNQRFLKDVEAWLGVKIESASNPKYPEHSVMDVFKDRKFMSGIHGSPCTVELKKRARQIWENENDYDWLVLGFTSEEEGRHKRFSLTERKNILPILIDDKITKDDCYRIIQEAGVELPAVYKLGLPNANCLGCVKATSPTYWNKIRELFPDKYKALADMSRELGAKLVRVKGTRIFLDELDPKATGRPLKSMDIECGLFCEEKQ